MPEQHRATAFCLLEVRNLVARQRTADQQLTRSGDQVGLNKIVVLGMYGADAQDPANARNKVWRTFLVFPLPPGKLRIYRQEDAEALPIRYMRD